VRRRPPWPLFLLCARWARHELAGVLWLPGRRAPPAAVDPYSSPIVLDYRSRGLETAAAVELERIRGRLLGSRRRPITPLSRLSLMREHSVGTVGTVGTRLLFGVLKPKALFLLRPILFLLPKKVGTDITLLYSWSLATRYEVCGVCKPKMR
jgi:hypothetical protein